MCRLLSIVTTLVIFEAINAIDLPQIRDKSKFVDCIVNHESVKSFKDIASREDIEKVMKLVAKSLFKPKYFLQPVTTAVNLKLISRHLKNQKFYWDIDDSDAQKELHLALLHAASDCIETYVDPQDCLESDHENGRCDPPVFKGEPSWLANVLNFMLVEWPETPSVMISTRQGRALLRRYTEDGIRELECTLTYYKQLKFFRMLIRVIWARRAQLYFDCDNEESFFSNYCYTMEIRIPQTCVCSEDALTYESMNKSPSERDPTIDPVVQRAYLSRHQRPSTGQIDEYDIFAKYETNGMNFSQLYLEIFIDQFYRILFFNLELRLRGIVTDADDNIEGPLDFEVVPENIQAIVHDDAVYGGYLLSLRERLVAVITDTENPIRQNLIRLARPYEEDMVLLFIHALDVGAFSQTTTTTSTTTTSTTTMSSTSEMPIDKKGKIGRLYLNQCGRHFINRPRSEFPESCCFCENENVQLDSNQKMSIASCFQSRYNYLVTSWEDPIFSVCSVKHSTSEWRQQRKVEKYYGFVNYEGHVDSLPLSADESSAVTTAMRSVIDNLKGLDGIQNDLCLHS